MRIVGEWHLFDDGVTRPLVQAQVLGKGGIAFAEDFLIDTGAVTKSSSLLQDITIVLNIVDPPAGRRPASPLPAASDVHYCRVVWYSR